MSNINLPTLLSFSWVQLSRGSKLRLIVFSVARILVNLLDLAGIAAIGILTLHFLPNGGSQGPIVVFGITLPTLDQESALGLASLVLVLFVLKSYISISLTTKFLSLLAVEETKFVGQILGVLPAFLAATGKRESLSTIQMTLGQGARSLFSGVLGTALVFVSEGSLFLMIAIVLAITNASAAVLMFLYFGVVSLFLVQLVSKRVLKFASTAEKSTQRFNSGLSDFLGSAQEISLAGNSRIWIESLLDKRKSVSGATISIQTHYTLPRYVIESALIAGIFLLLGYFVLFSDLVTAAPTIGIFLAGSLRLTSALMPLQNALNVFKSHQASGQFAFKLFSSSKETADDQRSFISSSNPLARGDEIIRFLNVSFALPNKSDLPILQDLSFAIRKGEKFAIVGPSGAGKTTLLKLLLGLTPPTHGEIEVFVESPKEHKGRIPNYFSLVPQKPNLVLGGLEENVTLRPDSGFISHEELVGLLDKVQLSHILTYSPVDLKHLSGGEVQRISLARALWSKSQVIVLDEATSSLDANSESSISDSLGDLKGEVTQIVVAHRLSTIQDADRILYLDNGRILAIDSFDRLRELVPAFDDAVRQMSF